MNEDSVHHNCNIKRGYSWSMCTSYIFRMMQTFIVPCLLHRFHGFLKATLSFLLVNYRSSHGASTAYIELSRRSHCADGVLCYITYNRCLYQYHHHLINQSISHLRYRFLGRAPQQTLQRTA